MAVSVWWNEIKDAVSDSNVLLLPVDTTGSWFVVNEGPLVISRITASGEDDGSIEPGASATLAATTFLWGQNASLRLYRGGADGLRSRAKLGTSI